MAALQWSSWIWGIAPFGSWPFKSLITKRVKGLQGHKLHSCTHIIYCTLFVSLFCCRSEWENVQVLIVPALCVYIFILINYVLMTSEKGFNKLCFCLNRVYVQVAERDTDQDCSRSSARGGSLLSSMWKEAAPVSRCNQGESTFTVFFYGKSL